jgi:glutamate-1-semialdehyde 2,1-aminomutase
MEHPLKVVAIVQARMGSTRLPGKVMKTINGVPMIELLLRRLSKSKEVNQIIVATSIDPANRLLIDHVKSIGFACEQGSEEDVLGRYVQVGASCKADIVVRITGDCPLIDPELVDACIAQFRQADVDYLSNTNPPTYPDGLDVSVVKFSVLKQAATEAKEKYDREHVMPYIRTSGKFSVGSTRHEADLSGCRWTVDDPADFEVITNIFNEFFPNIFFSWRQIYELQQLKPVLFAANRATKRNQGAHMGTGQKLWQRAKRVIPGGNMLLSKRAEMFLPEAWPAYYSKAKGCRVWDLDGREYVDMSIMGIGTNTLGYGHPKVDEAVLKTIQAGNMSTFNCPEEVYLAERLIELHPWADMARFARSGGEANAIAIRIARAASGKDKVAICGYHGWHDWYLSANLGDDKSLDGHLLPGLEPNGVPRSLKGTVFPFAYNRFEDLERLVSAEDIGVIKMEVRRNEEPEDDFLQKVRKLATQKGIVLIFDECTSGFRETFGGLHKKYGVEPDMAMFGKALGNGYAITATIGKREIMEAAQTTFISSTFWTERIGPSAALATLSVMEHEKSWEKITGIGNKVAEIWRSLGKKYQLEVIAFGLPALIKLRFYSKNNLEYKTLITQEMLKKGFLAGNSVYVCTEHSSNVLEAYKNALDPIFGLIRECENGRDIKTLLDGPTCHAEFRRLN